MAAAPPRAAMAPAHTRASNVTYELQPGWKFVDLVADSGAADWLAHSLSLQAIYPILFSSGCNGAITDAPPTPDGTKMVFKIVYDSGRVHRSMLVNELLVASALASADPDSNLFRWDAAGLCRVDIRSDKPGAAPQGPQACLIFYGPRMSGAVSDTAYRERWLLERRIRQIPSELGWYAENVDMPSFMYDLRPAVQREAVDVLFQISRALTAMHSVGIVHGDIRLLNMLTGAEPGDATSGPDVYASRAVYLTDFGFSMRKLVSEIDLTYDADTSLCSPRVRDGLRPSFEDDVWQLVAAIASPASPNIVRNVGRRPSTAPGSVVWNTLTVRQRRSLVAAECYNAVRERTTGGDPQLEATHILMAIDYLNSEHSKTYDAMSIFRYGASQACRIYTFMSLLNMHFSPLGVILRTTLRLADGDMLTAAELHELARRHRDSRMVDMVDPWSSESVGPTDNLLVQIRDGTMPPAPEQMILTVGSTNAKTYINAMASRPYVRSGWYPAVFEDDTLSVVTLASLDGSDRAGLPLTLRRPPETVDIRGHNSSLIVLRIDNDALIGRGALRTDRGALVVQVAPQLFLEMQTRITTRTPTVRVVSARPPCVFAHGSPLAASRIDEFWAGDVVWHKKTDTGEYHLVMLIEADGVNLIGVSLDLLQSTVDAGRSEFSGEVIRDLVSSFESLQMERGVYHL